MARDGCTEAAVRQRMGAQMSSEDKAARADHVLDNSGDLDALEEIYEQIDRLAAPSEAIVERTEATPIGLWLLLASLPVLLLGAALRGSRWGVLP